MKQAEVPTVPGSEGVIDDVDKAVEIANEAGYPVLLKSAYGGGGTRYQTSKGRKRIEARI